MSLPDGYLWFVASNEEHADLVEHIHRVMHAPVLRIGPGLGGRFLVLLGPRESSPPHDHRISGYRADPDHPARCRSPQCWGRTVISCDGELVHLT